MTEQQKKMPRTMTGRVRSAGADKTIAVSVERRVPHPLYGKFIRRSTRVLAHDEENSCRAGDLVTVEECRPYSKRKSWKVQAVLERASG